MKRDMLIKGNIIYAENKDSLAVRDGAYIRVKNGVCRGIFGAVPEELKELPVEDLGDSLVIPGLVDLHIHAPQYAYRGTGMDCELMEWLDKYAFPEEARYADPEYAERAYGIFAESLRSSATTRAVIFGTMHFGATLKLMELMEGTGLVSFVGKVNMDRGAPKELLETPEEGEADVRRLAAEAKARGFKRTKPILTPRFIPSCTEEMLGRLARAAEELRLPVQSHLSENLGEIELVKELMPEAEFYGDCYDRFGLFGGRVKTVMAHCVHSSPEEIERMKKRGVFIAHCPDSNMNVASGVAPVRKYLDRGMRIGLASDVAGGHTESIFRAMTAAIQASKLYWRCIDRSARPISFSEAFFMATKGGGRFFGKVGSFEDGYEFDAVVIDDSVRPAPRKLPTAERLERAVYLGLDALGLKAKYVRGERIV